MIRKQNKKWGKKSAQITPGFSIRVKLIASTYAGSWLYSKKYDAGTLKITTKVYYPQDKDNRRAVEAKRDLVAQLEEFPDLKRGSAILKVMLKEDLAEKVDNFIERFKAEKGDKVSGDGAESFEVSLVGSLANPRPVDLEEVDNTDTYYTLVWGRVWVNEDSPADALSLDGNVLLGAPPPAGKVSEKTPSLVVKGLPPELEIGVAGLPEYPSDEEIF